MKTQPTNWILSVVAAVSVLGFTGCQSWSTGGYPLQNPSRVQPPSTGAYQVPSTYYNNTGGQVSQLYQGVDPNGVQAFTSAGVSTTNLMSAPVGAVQPANFAQPAASYSPQPVGTSGFVASSSAPVAGQAVTGQAVGPTNVQVNAGSFPATSGRPISTNLSDTGEVQSFDWQR